MTARASIGSRQTGFTLVELVVTLVVMAILVTVAIPGFGNFIANQRVKTGAQELFASLNYTRSEAIRRNGSVYLISKNGSNGPVWAVTPSSGLDPTKCVDGTASAGDCLRVVQTSSDLDVSASPSAKIEYQRNGRVAGPVTFTLCDADSSETVTSRIIRVDRSGRPNLTLGEDCAS